MPEVARLCSAEGADFIPCERPFSNFDLVEERFGGILPMRRILSQARMRGARTIVVEGRLNEPSDLQEEDEDILALREDFRTEETEAYRVSFFGVPATKEVIGAVPDDAFIGYAIYKKDAIKARVYESVFATSQRGNNYVRGAPSWACNVAGRSFTIEGYLYAQQNGLTNSCAHVAARTVATRFLRADLSYRQMNEWVSTYREAKGIEDKPPGDGLTNDEICHILEKSGARTFVADCERAERPPVPYQLRLYSSIESGFPGIVFFGTERQTAEGETAYHVVPVFGHTFNEDTWAPGADLLYFPLRKATKCLTSSAWVSMFVGHDDNSGSNYCIPQHYMEPHRVCRNEAGDPVLDDSGAPLPCRQQGGSVSYAIATVVAGIEVDPIEAEAIAADYLLAILSEVPDTFDGWTRRWQNRLAFQVQDELHVRRPEAMILRTSLVTGREYAQHMATVRGWDRSKKIPNWFGKALRPVANDPFWIVEVSIPELFSANRRKVGEILIRADMVSSPDRDAGSFLLARLPGCFAFLAAPDAGVGADGSKASFSYYPADIDDHVELIGCEDTNFAASTWDDTRQQE